MTNEPEYLTTYFLDTNALHLTATYLRDAKKLALPPVQPGSMSFSQIRKKLSNKMPSDIAEEHMKGCQVLTLLVNSVAALNEDGSAGIVYASRLSKAEMIWGTLDGKAHAKMAMDYMPYRWRQTVSNLSKLVSTRLEQSDYESVLEEVAELFSELDDHGINIRFAEEQEQTDAISRLSEFIQSRVFLEVIDCWIYACSLLVQADYLITFDGRFRSLANSICNPGRDKEYRSLRSEIEQNLYKLIPKLENRPVIVPKSEKLPRYVVAHW